MTEPSHSGRRIGDAPPGALAGRGATPRRPAALAWVCAGLALAACRGTADPATSPGAGAAPDIVLVSIDSLRADHLGCYGYGRDTSPTIDRLAGEGLRFANAVSTTSWTLPAHAAMFTGLCDSAHGATEVDARLADEHVTLAEVLAAAGYQTAGFFGGPFLDPVFGLGQGFQTWLGCGAEHARPDHLASHRDVTGPRTVERCAAWLSTATDRPMFLFVHLWDVHFDYVPPQRYVDLFDPGYQGQLSGEGFLANPAIRADMPARDLRHLVALYDGEIRFTDDTLGRILDLLEACGRLERALVVVTADHGEEFFEHGQAGHQKSLYEEVVRVPLIVRWPGRVAPGRVVDDQVQLVDLMPTLLSAAGVAPGLPVQGRDLLPLLQGDALPQRAALLELLCLGNRVRAVRTNDYKLVVDEGARRGAFFDLRRDPGETGLPGDEASARPDPRAETAVAQLKRLTELTLAWRQRDAGDAGERARIDDEMAQRLRALGYAGPTPPAPGPGTRRD